MNKLIIFIFSILLLGSCGNPDDLQIIDAWIYGENSSGTQYGRTPSSQVEQNYFIGAKVVNVGDDPQKTGLDTPTSEQASDISI